jgi:hypothetical protein
VRVKVAIILVSNREAIKKISHMHVLEEGRIATLPSKGKVQDIQDPGRLLFHRFFIELY